MHGLLRTVWTIEPSTNMFHIVLVPSDKANTAIHFMNSKAIENFSTKPMQNIFDDWSPERRTIFDTMTGLSIYGYSYASNGAFAVEWPRQGVSNLGHSENREKITDNQVDLFSLSFGWIREYSDVLGVILVPLLAEVNLHASLVLIDELHFHHMLPSERSMFHSPHFLPINYLGVRKMHKETQISLKVRSISIFSDSQRREHYIRRFSETYQTPGHQDVPRTMIQFLKVIEDYFHIRLSWIPRQGCNFEPRNSHHPVWTFYSESFLLPDSHSEWQNRLGWNDFWILSLKDLLLMVENLKTEVFTFPRVKSPATSSYAYSYHVWNCRVVGNHIRKKNWGRETLPSRILHQPQ